METIVVTRDPAMVAALRRVVRELDAALAAEIHSPRDRYGVVANRISGDAAYVSVRWDEHGVAGVLAEMERWYAEAYGEQAVTPLGPIGHVPFIYRGGVFTLRIPLRFGDPPIGHLKIDGMGAELAASMEQELVERLVGDLHNGLRNYEAMQRFANRAREIDNEPARLMSVAVTNVRACVDAVVQQRRADAAFFAQQAVEKAMKALLADRTGNYPRSHDLDDLLSRCTLVEPALDGFRPYVARVHFGMGVRYGEIEVSADAAVTAARAAIHVVGNFADGICSGRPSAVGGR